MCFIVYYLEWVFASRSALAIELTVVENLLLSTVGVVFTLPCMRVNALGLDTGLLITRKQSTDMVEENKRHLQNKSLGDIRIRL